MRRRHFGDVERIFRPLSLIVISYFVLSFAPGVLARARRFSSDDIETVTLRFQEAVVSRAPVIEAASRTI